jgi:hypothetical protein
MTKYARILAIIALFFGFVFLTGCIAQTNAGNGTKTIQIPVPSSQNASAGPFLFIIPINGSTIPSVYKKIWIAVHPMGSNDKSPGYYANNDSQGYGIMRGGNCSGECESNFWSFITRTNAGNDTIIIPTTAPCSQNGISGPFIQINPISTHYNNEIFEINGTTNLGIDKKIWIAVDEERRTAIGPYHDPDWNYIYSDSRGYVQMHGRDCGTNFWTYQVNLTGFHSGKQYWVNIHLEQNHSVKNYSQFFVREGGDIKTIPTPASCSLQTISDPFITINPVSNFTIGDIFEINGTTNLDENKIIHYYVYSGVVPLPTNVPTPNYFVTSGDIKIVRIDCNDSRWSFLVDSNNLTPWSHEFFVWVWTNNQTSSLGVHNESFLITHRPGSGRSWGEVK